MAKKKYTGKGEKGPTIEIDQNQFENCCKIQCTLEEIASFFNCSSDTIERWTERTYKQKFAEVFQQKRGLGRVSLRRRQMQDALEGNVTMLIWLGKQYLEQSDKSQQEVISWNKAQDELEREVFEKSQLLIEHLKNK